MVHVEGMLEVHALYWLEAAPDVLSYREQPCTLRYPDGNRLRRYTPDIEVTLVSGSSFYVEVKPWETAQQPEIAHKLSCIRSHLGREDRDYQVWTDRTIRRDPWLSNLRWLYARAQHRLPAPGQQKIALSLLQNHLPMSIGVAAERLYPHRLDVFGLVLDGLLVCDTTQPLSLDADVNFTPADYGICLSRFALLGEVSPCGGISNA